jgi:hypothetical protein
MTERYRGRSAALSAYDGAARAAFVVSEGKEMKRNNEKGRLPAALQDKCNSANRYCAVTPPEPQRSAENWFLDAATFMRDGELRKAIGAAMQGICRARASYGRG